MTLYLDVIFLENIIMNYIILLTTGMICKIEVKHLKIMISSILGASYAIMLYLLNMHTPFNSITKIVLSICMIYIAFHAPNVQTMLKQLLIFYLTSFCFGGVAYYLLYNVNPKLIQSANGVLLGTYPIKIAILGAILGFFILNLSFKIIKNKFNKKDMLYTIQIFYQDKKVTIKAMLDTGNMLTDPITSVPVLIVEAQQLGTIIPIEILENAENIFYHSNFEHVDEEIKTRCCILPFTSIGKNNGMMIGFRPDYLKIDTQEEELIRKKAIIGIYHGKISKNGIYSGLLGLNLLNNDAQCMPQKETHDIPK